ARHTRPVAPETARPRAAARLGHQPPPPLHLRRRPQRLRRLPLPRPPQTGTGRLDQSGVEDDGEQPEGEVLFADASGKEAARCRGGELEASVHRDFVRGPAVMSIQRLLYTIPLRLRSIFRGAQVEREMQEELRLHLEYKIDEGIASGLTPREARLAALRAMD